MLSFLGEFFGYEWSLPFEIPFILKFQSLAGKGSFLYYVMNVFSFFGEEYVLIGLMGAIYWCLDKKRGERIGFGIMCGNLLNPLIKNIVRRARPFNTAGSGIQNFRDVAGYSFPSGHSTGAATGYFGTAYNYSDKKRTWLWIVGIVLPLLIALSRTYVGAHFPTDVVCGLALGVFVIILLDLLYQYVNPIYIYLGAVIIGACGFFYCDTTDFYTGYGAVVGFLFGRLYESKFVNFRNTKVWWKYVTRCAVGGAIYLGFNSLIKLIFGGIIGDVGWPERIFRVCRYALIVFILVGPYTKLFEVFDKLYVKWGWLKQGEYKCDDTSVIE